MQSRRLPEDGRGRRHRWHLRRRRVGGGPGRPSAGFAISAIAGIAVLALSCGDGAVEPAPPPAPVVTTVTVSPTSATLTALEETTRFTAEVRDQNGQVMAGTAVAWASSDASVAAMDASGQVTSAGNGTATITATAGSVSGTAEVTVAQVVSAVSVSPAADTLVALGDTVRLVAEATDANGNAIAGAEFSWESSDAAIATVDATGLVAAVANGSATITATSGSSSGSATVSVAQEVSAVTVTPVTASIAALGDTLRLTAEALDGNEHVVAGSEFSWESSDATVASVDATGLVTAVASGSATITATAGDASGNAAVTVAQEVGAVAVSPAADTLVALGDTVRLVAEATDANGNAIAGAEFSWESSDAAVATVDATGLVAAVANGDATITATAGDASGSATVTVAQEVSAVEVVPDTATVLVGDTLRLAATATDANGQVVTGVAFAWASGDTAVAVVDASGLLTGVGAGQAQVTATAAGVTGRAQLTVVAPVPTTIAITPDTVVLTAVGQTEQLTAQVHDQLGRVMGGIPVAWSSADTTVAVVGSAGLVTAVGGGAATVTAQAGEASGDVFVTVMQSADSVTVTPPADTIALGDTLRLVAEAYDESGHVVAGAVFTWSSSNAAVATVDSSGLVRGVVVGTTTITAIVGDASGTSAITVTNPDRAALVSLYNATDGPTWVDNTNWLTDAPLGEWYGVETDDSGRVVALRLGCELWDFEKNECPAPGLKGGIPAELGKLSELEYLDFGYNHHLTGPIPPELGNLEKLWYLDLGYNRLTGPIPLELSRLTNLSRLYLRRNRLSGPVPAWLGGLSRLWYLDLDVNQLTGPIPAELGDLAELRDLNLCCNGLVGPLPPELGNLSNLTTLFLYTNALTGPIPSELGSLSNLTRLSIYANGLTGPIPPELGDLAQLTQLNLGGNDLTGTIPTELGRLSSLEYLGIHRNLLSGGVPAELGDLDNLTELGFSWNTGLHGPLPEELTRLRLRAFAFEETGVCIPQRQTFRTWLQSIGLVLGGTVGSCEELLSHRDVLRALYESTNGDGWLVATNWLSDAPLDDWHGVTADGANMVTAIALPNNGLSGVLSLEIGGLETLKELSLSDNPALGGELPQEMVRLSELAAVRLERTGLCVPDHELFREWLAGIGDARVAECPDDHGDDPAVATGVTLGEQVEGKLESWRDEDWFRLETGGHGALTLAMETDIDAIVDLLSSDGELLGYDGYGRNVIVKRLPSGVYYVAVRGARDDSRGSYTLNVSFEPPAPGARAYLTQATQSHDFTVPLVAGEDALLRVFIMADSSVTASRPPVRATFYRRGAETHSLRIDGSSVQVPWTMAEGDLDATANAVIPGDVLVPGVELVVEIDPDGTLDPALGIGGRIPEEGRMSLDIRAMPDFDVTVVPFLSTENPDSSGYKAAIELTAEHELFYETRDWLPVAGMDVSVRDAVLVDYDPKEDMFRVLQDVALLHVTDGASGYYMGVPPWIEEGFLGIAIRESKVSVSRLDGHTIAHEFGHNLSLRHAPCGNPLGVDGQYPHVRGKIGAWGYDFRRGTLVNPESFTDLMTYCHANDWISDYSFTKAAEYRTETQATTMASHGTGRVLVVRGGVAGGQLRLEPAFVLDAPPSLPDESGPYRLVGSDAQGEELFAIDFAMAEIADAETEGDGAFTFAIPVRDAWAETLAEITVVGREGYVSLTRDDPDAAPTALVLDAATGRIRAILRESPDPVTVQADARGAGLGIEVLFSRGIPDVAAWRR